MRSELFHLQVNSASQTCEGLHLSQWALISGDLRGLLVYNVESSQGSCERLLQVLFLWLETAATSYLPDTWLGLAAHRHV